MPVSIPPEILPILNALQITDPANSPWRRKEPWPIRRMRAHFFCDCRNPGHRVELISTHLMNRPIFIGQCPHCQTIYWRDALKDAL